MYKFNKRFAWLYIVVGVCFPCVLKSQTGNARPNVIFMMADDIGYHDLAAYGQDLFPTPNTDRLAREGILLTDAHSPSAICSPTRYAVLTGTDPFRKYHTSHVLFNGEPLVIGKNQSTIASFMKEAGYVTGIVGKWHLGLGDRIPRNINKPGRGPNEVGFDYSYIVADGHNMYPRYYIKNGKPVGGIQRPFESRAELLDRVGYKLVQMAPGGDWENRRPDEEIGETLASEVDRFIEKHADEPFFLYYPTCSIHFPLVPDNRFQGKSGIGPHGDFVMEFDWAVGRVLKTLERLNLTDNTLLVVTSDNGGYGPVENTEHVPAHPWRGFKADPFEGGHRVPFFAHWPGKIQPGTTNDTTISLVDLFATLSELTGDPLQGQEALDSFSFLNVLSGKQKEEDIRPYVVTGTRGMEYLTLRIESWKLVYKTESDESWLFNLDIDPLEKSSLSKIWPNRVEAMKTRLLEYLEEGSSRPGARGPGRTLKQLFSERDSRNTYLLKIF